MKRLTVLILALVLFGGVALLVQHGRATAYAPPNHECPSVPSLTGFKRGYPILIQTRNVSCAEALTVVRAMESNIGVTFIGLCVSGPCAVSAFSPAGLSPEQAQATSRSRLQTSKPSPNPGSS